jgi:hypothetical protein
VLFAAVSLLALVSAVVPAPLPAAAQSVTQVTGGGTADLSQFGMGVVIGSGGAAHGRFECLMAGRSRVPGLALMAVSGTVTSGAVDADGSATFGGGASVLVKPENGQAQRFTDVPFSVRVTAGGPGNGHLGHLALSVLSPLFDGAPGDTLVGDGKYTLPVETVVSGQIGIR